MSKEIKTFEDKLDLILKRMDEQDKKMCQLEDKIDTRFDEEIEDDCCGGGCGMLDSDCMKEVLEAQEEDKSTSNEENATYTERTYKVGGVPVTERKWVFGSGNTNEVSGDWRAIKDIKDTEKEYDRFIRESWPSNMNEFYKVFGTPCSSPIRPTKSWVEQLFEKS